MELLLTKSWLHEEISGYAGVFPFISILALDEGSD
jgi:hypothetical protein